MQCPGCGISVAPGTYYCPRCGYRLPMDSQTEITDRIRPVPPSTQQAVESDSSRTPQPFMQQNTGSFRSLRSFSTASSIPAPQPVVASPSPHNESAPLPPQLSFEQTINISEQPLPPQQSFEQEPQEPERPLPPPPEEFSPSQHTASQHVIRPDLIIERSNTPRPAGISQRLSRPLQMRATISRRRHPLRRLLVALVLLVLCAGVIASGIYFYPKLQKVFGGNHKEPVLGSLNQFPSGNVRDQLAAQYFTQLQISDAIDQNYQPVGNQPRFQKLQKVYLTFQITTTEAGFIQARWYVDDKQVASNSFKHQKPNNTGYFSYTYQEAGAGAVELYWCGKEDCSDALLAGAYGFAIDGL